ncbi:hypothetical protein, partial [Methylobacterium variabile]|uniref:hypothetical protein n=1 Tax=Methylobacterium variabile TaxID=298794 RepID=UPI001AE05075
LTKLPITVSLVGTAVVQREFRDVHQEGEGDLSKCQRLLVTQNGCELPTLLEHSRGAREIRAVDPNLNLADSVINVRHRRLFGHPDS